MEEVRLSEVSQGVELGVGGEMIGGESTCLTEQCKTANQLVFAKELPNHVPELGEGKAVDVSETAQKLANQETESEVSISNQSALLLGKDPTNQDELKENLANQAEVKENLTSRDPGPEQEIANETARSVKKTKQRRRKKRRKLKNRGRLKDGGMVEKRGEEEEEKRMNEVKRGVEERGENGSDDERLGENGSIQTLGESGSRVNPTGENGSIETLGEGESHVSPTGETGSIETLGEGGSHVNPTGENESIETLGEQGSIEPETREDRGEDVEGRMKDEGMNQRETEGPQDKELLSVEGSGETGSRNNLVDEEILSLATQVWTNPLVSGSPPQIDPLVSESPAQIDPLVSGSPAQIDPLVSETDGEEAGPVEELKDFFQLSSLPTLGSVAPGTPDGREETRELRGADTGAKQGVVHPKRDEATKESREQDGVSNLGKREQRIFPGMKKLVIVISRERESKQGAAVPNVKEIVEKREESVVCEQGERERRREGDAGGSDPVWSHGGEAGSADSDVAGEPPPDWLEPLELDENGDVIPIKGFVMKLEVKADYLPDAPGRPCSDPIKSPSLRLGQFSPQRLSPGVTMCPSIPCLSKSLLQPLSPPTSPNTTPQRDGDGGISRSSSRPYHLRPVTKPPLKLDAEGNAASGQSQEAKPVHSVCSRCGVSLPGWREGERELCSSCSPSDKKPPPSIVFRKVGEDKWVLGKGSQVKEEEESISDKQRRKKKRHLLPLRQSISRKAKLKNEEDEPEQEKQVKIAKREEPKQPNQAVLQRSLQLQKPRRKLPTLPPESEDKTKLSKIASATAILNSYIKANMVKRVVLKKEEEEPKQPKQVNMIKREELKKKEEEPKQPKEGRRRVNCKKCEGCLREDCGKCDHCLDKPKYGGQNTKKQKCRFRICQVVDMRHPHLKWKGYDLKILKNGAVEEVLQTLDRPCPPVHRRGRPRKWTDLTDDSSTDTVDEEEAEEEDVNPRKRLRRREVKRGTEGDDDEDDDEEDDGDDDGDEDDWTPQNEREEEEEEEEEREEVQTQTPQVSPYVLVNPESREVMTAPFIQGCYQGNGNSIQLVRLNGGLISPSIFSDSVISLGCLQEIPAQDGALFYSSPGMGYVSPLPPSSPPPLSFHPLLLPKEEEIPVEIGEEGVMRREEVTAEEGGMREEWRMRREEVTAEEQTGGMREEWRMRREEVTAEEGGMREEWRMRVNGHMSQTIETRTEAGEGRQYFDMEVEVPEFDSEDEAPPRHYITEVTRKVTDYVTPENVPYDLPEHISLTPWSFSLAGEAGVDRNDVGERGLLRLLRELRGMVLPAHWVGVLAAGPLLQLLQTSKLSTMADTMVQIQPGFLYQITVQGQPLLPTHRLFDTYPERFTNTSQVVSLLLDLEGMGVCQGVAYRTWLPRQCDLPLLVVRAATCQLLVLPTEERCPFCQEDWSEEEEEEEEE